MSNSRTDLSKRAGEALSVPPSGVAMSLFLDSYPTVGTLRVCCLFRPRASGRVGCGCVGIPRRPRLPPGSVAEFLARSARVTADWFPVSVGHSESCEMTNLLDSRFWHSSLESREGHERAAVGRRQMWPLSLLPMLRSTIIRACAPLGNRPASVDDFADLLILWHTERLTIPAAQPLVVQDTCCPWCRHGAVRCPRRAARRGRRPGGIVAAPRLVRYLAVPSHCSAGVAGWSAACLCATVAD